MHRTLRIAWLPSFFFFSSTPPPALLLNFIFSKFLLLREIIKRRKKRKREILGARVERTADCNKSNIGAVVGCNRPQPVRYYIGTYYSLYRRESRALTRQAQPSRDGSRNGWPRVRGEARYNKHATPTTTWLIICCWGA